MAEQEAGAFDGAGDQRQRFGAVGERLAATALARRGYRIIARNFRCRAGEIDLIAEESEDLVFIEVKTRRGTTRGLPEEAITARKARKLIQVASSYLALHGLGDCSWRIDVVAVQFELNGKLADVRIYQHAITATDFYG